MKRAPRPYTACMGRVYELGLALKADASATDFAIDPVALKAAQSGDGDASVRLERYVKAHENAGPLRASLDRVYERIGFAKACAFTLAALLGCGAAGSAFLAGPETQNVLNIFWLIAALLGPHIIALVFWVLLLWRPPKSSALQSILAFVLSQLRRLLPKEAAADVAASQLLTGSTGRWNIAATSHGFWLSYLLAAVLLTALVLAFQRFDFVWETTLLSTEQGSALLSAIRAPFAATGLPVPTEADILAAQRVGASLPQGQDNQRWAIFVIAAIALYGVLPRALLLMVSKVLLSRAIERQRLPLSAPYFANIIAEIYRAAVTTEIVDADEASVPLSQVVEAKPLEMETVNHLGQVIGWETDGGAVPNAIGMTHVDEEGPFLDAIAKSAGQPLAIAVSLLTSPDRGVARIFAAARASAGEDARILLLDEAMLAARFSTEDARQRRADWWSLLIQAGFSAERVHLMPSPGAPQ
ncbi:MAG: DUF2868 domain-containing protein [Pseudomonadota bacterium]